MKKQPSIFLKTPSKGYVFKLKVLLNPEDKINLINCLTKQFYDGILIYEDSILELVDTYDLNVKDIITNDNIIGML